MGRHEEAREATKRAIELNPTLARAQANLALERYGPTGGDRGRPAPAAPRVRRSSRAARWPTTTSGSPSGRRAIRRGAARVRAGARGGEDRRLTLQAMAEVHLLRRELPAALELYDALVREYADSPKLWNERGVCLHQAGRRAEADRLLRAGRGGGSAATSWPGTTSASCARSEADADARDRRVPARARRRAAAVRRAAQSRPPVPPAAAAPAGARGVSAARSPSSSASAVGLERRRARAHGAAAVRGRAQRVRPRGGRRRRLRRRRTTT